MYKIFIVEDNMTIAKEISELSKSWEFSSYICKDFQNIIPEFLKEEPQIVLLDIKLPFFNGYYWCEQIRKISKVPVIFISSASDNMNIVMAMNVGADDFIAKPFDSEVLIAKIQAVLRRTYDYAPSSEVISHKDAFLDKSNGSLKYNDEKIELTKNEYRILLCLLENKGKIVSREKLMERLWETDCFVDDNTLTVNINRLRKKLDGAGLEKFIETKVGQGYIIE